MAVHPDHPGFEVTVCVQGTISKEYLTDNDDFMPETEDQKIIEHRRRCTVANYIESVTDATFTINLTIKEPFKFDCHSLSVYAFADGEQIDSYVILKSDYTSNKKSLEYSIKGPAESLEGSSITRTMKFAAIEISMRSSQFFNTYFDSASASEEFYNSEIARQKLELASVGEIIIYIHRSGPLRKSKRSRSETDETRLKDHKYDEKIHEKVMLGDNKRHGVV